MCILQMEPECLSRLELRHLSSSQQSEMVLGVKLAKFVLRMLRLRRLTINVFHFVLVVVKMGGSKLGGVIVLSVLLFPLGLISGCMKGSMPKIQEGTTFNASVMQDISVE